MELLMANRDIQHPTETIMYQVKREMNMTHFAFCRMLDVPLALSGEVFRMHAAK